MLCVGAVLACQGRTRKLCYNCRISMPFCAVKSSAPSTPVSASTASLNLSKSSVERWILPSIEKHPQKKDHPKYIVLMLSSERPISSQERVWSLCGQISQNTSSMLYFQQIRKQIEGLEWTKKETKDKAVNLLCHWMDPVYKHILSLLIPFSSVLFEPKRAIVELEKMQRMMWYGGASV